MEKVQFSDKWFGSVNWKLGADIEKILQSSTEKRTVKKMLENSLKSFVIVLSAHLQLGQPGVNTQYVLDQIITTFAQNAADRLEGKVPSCPLKPKKRPTARKIQK